MGDDFRDYRKSKPQQKLYKPGSGPLRRSTYGLDGKMDIYVSRSGSRSTSKGYFGSQNSVNEEGSKEHLMTDARQRKPEQQLYVPKSSDSHLDMDRQRRSDNSSQYSIRSGANRHDKNSYNSGSSYSRGSTRRDSSYGDYHNKESGGNDVNYKRNHRQVSEPRARTPTKYASEHNPIDRNRDSRSMETSAGRSMLSSSGKPPSGRRNSAGYTSDSSRPHKYMINFENLPPRLRKKYLEEQGHHSFDNVDQISKDKYNNSSFHTNYDQNQYTNNSMWSQTLPSRGRGRIREADNFDREKFMNSFKSSYEMQNSRRSTPSSSYTNLYEPNTIENTHSVETDRVTAYLQSQTYNFESAPRNGTSNTIREVSLNSKNQESDAYEESDVQSHSSNNLLDMTNLDWSEEVEQNIKLDETSESLMSASFSQNLKISSTTQEVKPPEQKESKRSRRSRDKRSSSRGHRKERNRKDSVASNVSVQQETPSKQRERERRDSHRSNRSSTIGNSRDDLDRWRSLRSYSREHSTEGRIVSQCNSRDPSANRDNDGFRIPSTTWTPTQKKNGPFPGRTPSIERGRHSPAPGHVATEPAPAEAEKPSGGRRRKRSGRKKGRNSENAPPPAANAPVPSAPMVQQSASATTNWRAEILQSKQSQDKHADPPRRNRLNSNVSDKSLSELSTSQPGVLVLPQAATTHRDHGRGASVETSQKLLFDHQNPAKPIVVQTSPSRIDTRLERGTAQTTRGVLGETSDASRADRHRSLLQQVDRADAILQTRMHTRSPVTLADSWNEDVGETRRFLQAALQRLLMSDLKYCQADNIEHHFWKILYYNIIELLRRSLTQACGEDKAKIVKLIITIIEEGNVYFENLVQMLEKTYKFNTDDYLNDNHVLPPKGLGYVGLALISVQKLYVFLGDLARYKEQVNETNNFAKSKLWYTKAQQINPKNGRPYNQLAILAIYARRKLDAVYYYMRSLMSSNPFMSAKESLLSLFEENRKKYEAAERKRRAALELSKPVDVPESSSQTSSDSQTRHREKWIRPGVQSPAHHSDDDHFASMTSVELNKNFITSYLHVHGKLVTKIGMESFHECASAMLRQFRALLHRQPLPTPAARLLQLTALNMFAVETSAHNNDITGERSAWLNCALSVGLLMFGVLIERCCALLPEPSHSQQHSDALLLLPAIKVWSDWMLCHSSVWNPPPSFNSFDIGSDSNPWDWLAKLMNILEELDDKSIELEFDAKDGYNLVRLSEDASLAGFTPLMLMDPALGWADHSVPRQTAEHVLRTRKLLFFGTEYLVGVEPPVLKLEYPPDAPPRYESAVQNKESLHIPLQHLSEDSEDDDSTKSPASGPTSLTDVPDGADAATRRLLRRKEQLEKRKATLERRQQKMQEYLRSNSMEVEVRPKWLVPDTNCFIDHLPLLQAVVATPDQPYLLVIPLVVVTELEGLSRCERVGGHARAALAWVKTAGAGVKFATSQGSLLATRAFTAEKHAPATNDDRVLFTANNLHANMSSEPDEVNKTPQLRRVCEVVLLTDDRNLRVKALATDLPARDLPSFIQWAGITIVAPEKPTDVN